MLDKSKVKARFSKAQQTYDEQALIQKKVCIELAKSIPQFVGQLSFAKVLEIGCGSGIFTQEVMRHCEIDSLYLNDLYEEVGMLKTSTTQQHTQIYSLIGDIEKLEIPEHLDLIISSSAFQWMSDLPALLKKLHHALRPKGYLVFSTFGIDNLKEIKQLTGCGLDYFEIHILQQFLMACDFELVMMKQEVEQLYFDHPRDVLQHIKETGVTATGQYRWTKTSLQQFYQDYEQFARIPRSDQPTYPLTYNPIQCIVRKK